MGQCKKECGLILGKDFLTLLPSFFCGNTPIPNQWSTICYGIQLECRLLQADWLLQATLQALLNAHCYIKSWLYLSQF